MTWRTVHIKESDFIKLKLDNLEVQKQGEIFFIPLSDISMIILEGGNTTVTTKLLSKLSKYNICLVVCDEFYLPTGIYYPYSGYHRSSKRAQQQVAMTDQLKKALWQKIVNQKIENQIVFAKIKKVKKERIELMTNLQSEILLGDSTNREGHVAKVYFKSLYGNHFTRDIQCLENISMNFGYAIIRSAIARATIGQGLWPMLGIFHCNEYNAFNLVDDLMEPFRPLMDWWIHQEVLEKEDFLTYEARLRIINFLNQEMQYKTQKSSVDIVVVKYIKSFVNALEQDNPNLIYPICLEDLIGG